MNELPKGHYLENNPQQAARILDTETESRKRWVNMYLGEDDLANVTLGDSVVPVLPDPDMCGAGRGNGECYAYLACAPHGFTCERGGPHSHTLEKRSKNGEMGAERLPTEQWPDCMIFPPKAAEK